MLQAGAGTSCPPGCTYSEQSHQIPGYAFKLPKSQQLRGSRLQSRSIPERYVRSVRSRRPFIARAEAHGAPTAPWKQADARLVLADGSVWRGKAFGATDTEIGEVVFNTSITGYEEIMTDPSYRGQFVVFTHPHIGNVGINTGHSLVQEEAHVEWWSMQYVCRLVLLHICCIPLMKSLTRLCLPVCRGR